MTYRIGFDFGSSTTKIAYLDDQDRLHLFCYPGPTGNAVISTVLACSVQAGQLHTAALEDRIPEFTAQHRNHFVCEHFKAAIAQAESGHWRACEWSIPLSPTDVTSAYLHQLLWENPLQFYA